ncbi:RNA chaperone Hfq [Candidatus Hepatobacter penaei]|jgi:host factor-I protein|uniref:RNA chaperone Hfq n=1 Tax=Candidatus Hepatobacter penaei TaxID=1274402 RepID=UPI0004F2F6FE|nr:RNA chaperone Hfq [Candidatus Hepatobacter penaei]TGW15800.1 RNA chaperone Hfq [bacterium NHP-B]
MTDKKSLQDHFLNVLRKEKAQTALFLINGVKLQGIITGFDSFSLTLKNQASVQLIYKSAISTISPLEPIQLYTPNEPEQN